MWYYIYGFHGELCHPTHPVPQQKGDKMKRLLSSVLAIALAFSICPQVKADEAMEVSAEGVDFIKNYEGFRSMPYLDNGVWRIGYGSECDPDDYIRGISEKEATEMFSEYLEKTAAQINNYMDQHGVELDQNQFDALASFTYNLGTGWMNPSYKFSSYLINGLGNYDDLTILDAYVVWCHIGKNVDAALAERRIGEAQLLLYGDYRGNKAPDFTYAVLNANGGDAGGDIICFLKGDTLERLPVPKRKGYVSAGWYNKDGQKVSSDDIIDGPIELTAKWFVDVDLPFTDVPDGAWYYGYVGELYSKGIVGGMSPTIFEPGGKVTYGQALKLILLATGLEPSDEKMEGHWAQPYEDLAIEEGIVKEGYLDLNAQVTRAQIAYIASRAMGLDDASGKTPFADTGDEHIKALYNAGIVEGTTEKDGNTYFYPDDNIIRSEITTIIWRILNHDTDTMTGKIQYASHVLDILKGVDKYTRNDDNYYEKNGYLYYLGEDTSVGIDVSSYQGDIDWKKVKRDGVDFAIIRVGGRGYGSDGIMYDDIKFEENIEGALDAGLDVGVYYFSQAITKKEAREEAEYVIEKIDGYDITYPVVFDWERIGGSEARTYGLETDILCDVANTFCEIIEDEGYTPMIYFNSYVGYIKYDLSKINDYDFWFARYNDVPDFYYDFDMWQYSDSGSVNGIKGKVDLNICFKDYSK